MPGKRSPTSHRTPEQIRQHYKDYQGTPEQIAKRSMRNKARAAVKASAGSAAIAGKDIDHKVPIRSGGSNDSSNLRIRSISSNRGWESEKKAKRKK
jgi:hypothetical protein